MDYLAMPWATLTPEQAKKMMALSVTFTAQYAALGLPVFNPIMHSRPLVEELQRLNLPPIPHAHWLQLDSSFLKSASRLIVLAEDELWAHSKGVHYEIGYMQAQERPIVWAYTADDTANFGGFQLFAKPKV
jgi:nucleoside 2-deoxyribosyltransferase